MSSSVTVDDVGRTTATEVFEVEKGAIRHFAEAIGDPNPLFHDEEFARRHGYSSVLAPPSFATTLRLPFPVELEMAHVLHGEEEYVYQRPIVAGDRLACQSRVASVKERKGSLGGMTLLVIDTTGSEATSGDPVFVARSTVIIRQSVEPGAAEAPPSGAAAAGPAAATGPQLGAGEAASKAPTGPQIQPSGLPASSRPPATPDGGVRTASPHLVELHKDDELLALVKEPISRVQLAKYAGASGDFNSIHLDDEAARRAGLGSVIAHGMLSMGFLGQLAAGWAGPDGRVVRLAARFAAMVRPGDVLTVHGLVNGVSDRTILSLWAENQRGERVTKGEAEVLLPN